MTELHRSPSTQQTFASKDYEGSYTVHLLDLETSAPTFFIAHLGIVADVQIENPKKELVQSGCFLFSYTHNYRQRLLQGVRFNTEATALGEIIFLDRYKPDTIKGQKRYMAAMVVAEDFYDKDQELVGMANATNPYDFEIGVFISDWVELALE